MMYIVDEECTGTWLEHSMLAWGTNYLTSGILGTLSIQVQVHRIRTWVQWKSSGRKELRALGWFSF